MCIRDILIGKYLKSIQSQNHTGQDEWEIMTLVVYIYDFSEALRTSLSGELMSIAWIAGVGSPRLAP
jgi:hypothetical protein